MNTTTLSFKRIDLFIVVISSLLMFAVANLPFKVKPFGDATFHIEGKNLALYLKGDMPYKEVMISKAPGPVFFYAAVYLFAPSDATDDQLWNYGVIFTSIVITLSMLLIFRAATAFFSKEIAVLSMLLFFIFPMHCYYSLGISGEPPAFFSLAMLLYGWSVAFYKPESKSGWLWLIAGMGFLILNRPNAMLILLLGVVIVFYAWFRNKAFFAKYGKQMLVSFFCTGLIAFGVLEMSKAITANKTDVDQQYYFYYVAHQGRFQFRNEPTDIRYWENDIRSDSKDYQDWIQSARDLSAESKATGRSHNEVYRDFLINDALQHPFLLARQFVIKCVYGHLYYINSLRPEKFKMGPLQGATGFYIFILIINLVNILIMIGAAIFLFKQKNLINYWVFWGVIVALLIFHGLIYMEPRYIFPTKAALYIMSAAGLYRLAFIRKYTDKFSGLFFKS
ncbi:hypothetical protein FNO01nite_19950 [Flavobacterium noncentrifugens]|uniref:Dolichyl-phosphate-mannose-protein mannosyltransferase n=1 Tax=Flavobacterium noncentrifugens TaxID=1128970 RepID=A0A1G8YQQ2_9FLAO|nr:glycosyltransferase family 39 protein [Flavobacterium noncentrifugens]GEP51323.1 hypothetical protein FNO01nite_19950 [Flavobacterium noncentrifugens]SDK05118.1 Dolichyl-phosphate-mannose-protein mannosyltransferase [Flavobacterium noncentrifugens]